MTDKLREQISALVDGELDETEARLLIRRFAGNSELGEVWERYQNCRALIAGLSGMAPGTGLAARVRASLDTETHADRRPSHRFDWLRPVAGLAVAATVATVAVLGLQGGMDDSEPGPTEIVPAPSASVSPWSTTGRLTATPASGSWDGVPSEDRRRLNPYLVNHSDGAAGISRLEPRQEAVEDDQAPPLKDPPQ
jgi:sigma-E factor negative regulatory protein RseA